MMIAGTAILISSWQVIDPQKPVVPSITFEETVSLPALPNKPPAPLAPPIIEKPIFIEFHPWMDTVPAPKKPNIVDLDKELEKLDKVEEHLEKALNEIDWNKIEKEISLALKNIDTKKIEQEINQAMKEIDMAKIESDTKKAIAKIDWEEIKQELKKVKEIELPKVELEMEKVKEELKNLKPEIEKELENARKEIEKARKVLKQQYYFQLNRIKKPGCFASRFFYFIMILFFV